MEISSVLTKPNYPEGDFLLSDEHNAQYAV